MVDSFCFVGLKSEIRRRATQTPYLDSPVQTRRSKGIGVLWVDRKAHNVVRMSFKNLHAFPLLVPIPELDCHIIASGQDERLGRVDDDCTDVIRVGFE